MGKKVRDTSILAYVELAQTGKLGERQQQVLEQIQKHPDLTDTEICFSLGLGDPNMVRPRRYELMKKGLIYASGKRLCEISRRLAYTWRMSGN